jgi:hypothetical protein
MSSKPTTAHLRNGPPPPVGHKNLTTMAPILLELGLNSKDTHLSIFPYENLIIVAF